VLVGPSMAHAVALYGMAERKQASKPANRSRSVLVRAQFASVFGGGVQTPHNTHKRNNNLER
jgi:hypothetical protein